MLTGLKSVELPFLEDNMRVKIGTKPKYLRNLDLKVPAFRKKC